MNLQESISHLKRIGWHISKEGENYRCHRIGYKKYCVSPSQKAWNWDVDNDDLYSPREIITKAKIFSAANNQNTALKRAIKTGQKTKERPKVRDILSSFNEDEIDNLDTKKLDDIWNYD